MRELAKPLGHAHKHTAPSTGADVAAMYLSKDPGTSEVFFTLNRRFQTLVSTLVPPPNLQSVKSMLLGLTAVQGPQQAPGEAL